MAIKLGDVEFDGHQGQLQAPAGKFEYYTRMGDNQIYVQKLKTEGKESNIRFWVEKTNYSNCQTHVNSMIAIKGLRKSYEDSHGNEYNSVYLIDFDYSISKKGGNRWLVDYNATLIADERAS